MTKPLQVTGIGHALVDIIAPCEEQLLEAFALTKGTMRLTSSEEAAALYDRMGPAIETSGGSAANTCAGIASLGGSAGFMGTLGRDQFASVFAHDIRSIGVAFNPAETSTGTPTSAQPPNSPKAILTALQLRAAKSSISKDICSIPWTRAPPFIPLRMWPTRPAPGLLLRFPIPFA